MSLPRRSLSVSFAVAMQLGVFANPVTALAEEAAEAETTAHAPARQDAVCDAEGGFVGRFQH